jgi:hypothetical protein
MNYKKPTPELIRRDAERRSKENVRAKMDEVYETTLLSEENTQ